MEKNGRYAAKGKLKECKACGEQIAASAKTCPHCGAKNKKPFYKKAWFWVLIVFLLIGSTGGGEQTEATEPASVNTAITSPEQKIEETELQVSVMETEENAETTAPEETQDTETVSQKNALRSAKSYLNFSAFSYDGLINQLEYEKFSHEDAVYAADHCEADWNEQALKSAKSYLDFSAFSYTGLIDQLEYEGFTNEQAKYGVDNCNADWNEQAAKSAESYLEYSAFSRDGLISQLEFEGFTREQAIYGVEENGL